MGFRFRRRLRIAPGLYVNVSKSGLSTSIGGRGATVNLNRKGVQTTAGLPGSGISYRSSRKPWLSGAAPGSAPGSGGALLRLFVVLAIVGVILAAVFGQH